MESENGVTNGRWVFSDLEEGGSMRRTRRLVSAVCLCLGVVLLALPGFAGNTYTNDIPNVSVTKPDYYEFDIVVTQASGSYATLSVRVHDVDEESGEWDEVYLNGHYLGLLSGTNQMWSTTTFVLEEHEINYSGENGGVNTVRIWIDPHGDEGTAWVAEIDWGQILIDGGSAEDAEILSVSADGTWDALWVDTEVLGINGDTFRLEINLLDSTLNNKDIAVETFSLMAGETSVRSLLVGLPFEPTETETFTIEANLFNETTGVQQNLKTTTWTYSAALPPTDILLTSDRVEENQSIGTIVGFLSAIDDDSFDHTFTLVAGDVSVFAIVGDELRTTTVFDHETQSVYGITIQAEDESGGTHEKSFSIYVDDVNDPPVIGQGDLATVTMDEDGQPTDFHLVLQASDEDGDPIEWSIAQPAARGSAAASGTGTDQEIDYSPTPDVDGSDAFVVRVDDGRGGTDEITVAVTVRSVNDAPVGRSDVYGTDQDEDLSAWPGVLDNDSDVEGDPLTAELLVEPSHGLIEWEADGTFVYRPAFRYAGTDAFTYRVSDGQLASEPVEVTVEVRYVNTLPFADAGGPYEGEVGQPVMLSAQGTFDADLTDRLQYRWDFDNNWVYDTDWLDSQVVEHTWPTPYQGLVVLQVRDLFENEPTGDVVEVSASVYISSIQSIRVVIEDSAGGASLAGVGVSIGGQQAVTGPLGTDPVRLDSGMHAVAIDEASIDELAARGYVIEEAQQTIQLLDGEAQVVRFAAQKTSAKLKGIVYIDQNGNGELDDEDPRVSGVSVLLDDDQRTTTDRTGVFTFRRVAFGAHRLTLAQGGGDAESGDIPSIQVEFLHARDARSPIEIIWPHDAESVQEGFLRVDVERE